MINFTEFLTALRGKPDDRRQAIIDKAFLKFDKAFFSLTVPGLKVFEIFDTLPNSRPFFHSPCSFASIAHATVLDAEMVSSPSSSSFALITSGSRSAQPANSTPPTSTSSSNQINHRNRNKGILFQINQILHFLLNNGKKEIILIILISFS